MTGRNRTAWITLIVFAAVAGGCDRQPATPADAAPAPTPAATPAPVAETPAPATPAVTPPTPVPSGRPQVQVQPREIHFGEVAVGSSHVGTFTLHNAGAEPLTIEKATPSCKCTTTEELAGRVIPAGGTTTVTATLNMPSTPGSKDAKLYIKYVGYQHQTLVKLLADSVMAIEASPPYVDALKGKKSGQLVVRSRDGQPFRILSSNGQRPEFIGYDADRDPPRAEYTVAWNVEGWPCEGMRLWWVLETDVADCPILPARIRHECTGAQADPGRQQRGWFFKEFVVNAGQLNAGAATELELIIDDRRDARVTAIESLDPRCTAQLLAVERGADGEKLCRFRFTAGREVDGFLYANLRVSSTSGDGIVPLIARVVGP